jgi:hypothetical protein
VLGAVEQLDRRRLLVLDAGRHGAHVARLADVIEIAVAISTVAAPVTVALPVSGPVTVALPVRPAAARGRRDRLGTPIARLRPRLAVELIAERRARRGWCAAAVGAGAEAAEKAPPTVGPGAGAVVRGHRALANPSLMDGARFAQVAHRPALAAGQVDLRALAAQ